MREVLTATAFAIELLEDGKDLCGPPQPYCRSVSEYIRCVDPGHVPYLLAHALCELDKARREASCDALA